jgi:hypothetical protein
VGHAIKDTLNEIFAVPLNWEVPQAGFGIRLDAINFGDKPFVGVKNEARLDGDASL